MIELETKAAVRAPLIELPTQATDQPPGGWGYQSLLIRQIRRDGGTQARVGNNEDTVQEYAELMREHRWDFRTMQRPIVLWDGESFWLADGFHRIEAAQRAGLSDYPIEILRGSQRDAVLRAAGANSQHGLRRTREDVQRAITLLLKDEEWRQWSNVKIAAQVGCSDKTVAELRRKLESGSEIPSLTIRQGTDGKSYPVAPAAPKEAPTTPADVVKNGVQLVKHGSWWQPTGFSGVMNGWVGTAEPWDLAVAAARAEIERRTTARYQANQDEARAHGVAEQAHIDQIVAKTGGVFVAPADITDDEKRIAALSGYIWQGSDLIPGKQATYHFSSTGGVIDGATMTRPQFDAWLKIHTPIARPPAALPLGAPIALPALTGDAAADTAAMVISIRELAEPLGLQLIWEDDRVLLYWSDEADKIEQMDMLSYGAALEWLKWEAKGIKQDRESDENAPIALPPPTPPDHGTSDRARYEAKEERDSGRMLRARTLIGNGEYATARAVLDQVEVATYARDQLLATIPAGRQITLALTFDECAALLKEARAFSRSEHTKGMPTIGQALILMVQAIKGMD